MKKEEQKKESRSPNKGGYFVHRMAIRKQAVEEYDQGVPVQEILAKYKVCNSTLWLWRRQIEKGQVSASKMTRRPEELKLRIVKEIVTGIFTIKEASAHYDIRKDAIQKWCSKYSCQISDLTEPMAKKQANNRTPQNDHIRQLERALEDANLKIIGLETMINIAENDLKIDIRKKSGTKQSKS